MPTAHSKPPGRRQGPRHRRQQLHAEHLTRFLDATSVVPAVNQIEVHPYFRQPAVLAADTEHGIVPQAWSPIGGITFYRDTAYQHLRTRPSPASPGLRQNTGAGHVALAPAARPLIDPHVRTPHRIAEYFDVSDFDLAADELAAIDGLDTGRCGGPSRPTSPSRPLDATFQRLDPSELHLRTSLSSTDSVRRGLLRQSFSGTRASTDFPPGQ